MSRKLYALFILIGAVAALVLFYLYFFVYYTSTLTIESNVPEYRVELFSKSTAQKWEYDCPEEVCVLKDVSPFEYNVSIFKENYKTELMNIKVAPRRKESLFIELEKQAELAILEKLVVEETAAQKIKRLREKNSYYASFGIWEDEQITFTDISENQLAMQYRSWDIEREIYKFQKVRADDIYAEYISDTDKIFLNMAGKYYILYAKLGSIHELPYELQVHYVKPSNKASEYIIVTENGSFLYDISSWDSRYQYLFHDFVYHEDALIGVIGEDETQKKSNFNISQRGNLIVRYTEDNKQRKVLLNSTPEIDRIEKIWEKIIFTSGDNEYELQNF